MSAIDDGPLGVYLLAAGLIGALWFLVRWAADVSRLEERAAAVRYVSRRWEGHVLAEELEQGRHRDDER